MSLANFESFNFSKLRQASAVVSAVTVLTLVGCGGGGVTGDVVTGRVMDGYLVGAKVCFDANANGLCDSNEWFAQTEAGGRFSISVADGANLSSARLAVEVPATAIDEDTGNPVGTAYRMMGFAGSGSVVNPLTTVIAAHVDSGMTIAQAVAQTKADLGIDFDPAEDYVASGNAAVHNVARVLAGAFQQYDLSSSASIRSALSAIKVAAMTAFNSGNELLDATALSQLVASIVINKTVPDVVFASGYGSGLNPNWIDELQVYKQGDTNEGGIFGWGISPDADIWANTWSGVGASDDPNGANFYWGTWDGRLLAANYIESWVMHPAGLDITGMGRISLKIWGNPELNGQPRFTPLLESMPVDGCTPSAEYDGTLIAAAPTNASFQLSFNDFVIKESCNGKVASMADFLKNDLKTVRVRIYKANTNSVAGINIGPVSFKP